MMSYPQIEYIEEDKLKMTFYNRINVLSNTIDTMNFIGMKDDNLYFFWHSFLYSMTPDGLINRVAHEESQFYTDYYNDQYQTYISDEIYYKHNIHMYELEQLFISDKYVKEYAGKYFYHADSDIIYYYDIGEFIWKKRLPADIFYIFENAYIIKSSSISVNSCTCRCNNS